MNMKRVGKIYKSELTVSGDAASRKNYLGVLISIFVLILISSMIVASIVIVNPEIVNFLTKPYTPREAVTLEDSLLGELYPNDFNFQWLNWAQRRAPARSSSGQKQVDELLYEDLKNLKLVQLNATPTSGRNRIKASNSSSPFLPDSNSNSNLNSNEDSNSESNEDFHSNISTLISNSSLLASIEFQGFKLSPSKRYLLVWTNKIKQFRHSFTAKFFIYDIKLDLISLLSTQQNQNQNQEQENNEQATSNEGGALGNSFEHLDSAAEYLNDQDQGNEFNRFQHADWFCSTLSAENEQTDPSRREEEEEGNCDSLILIQKNDLFVLENISINQKSQIIDQPKSRESSSSRTPRRLTFTGKLNEIFNGIPDWLYEEEILGDSEAYQISPKATTLAYMSFNDSLVDLMSFSIYGPYNQIIPKTQQIRYSKTGRPNPIVKVYIIEQFASNNLKSIAPARRSIQLKLPAELEQEQHYVFRIKWLTNDKLLLNWLNRQQNEAYFLICSRDNDWKCEKNLYQSSKLDGGWLDMSDDIIPLDEKYYFALLLKDEGPEVGKFKHLAKITIDNNNNNNNFSFLTGGKRELVSIDGIDRVKKRIYFTSTVENEPGQRQTYFTYYETQFSNSTQQQEQQQQQQSSTCLTCDFYPQECLYNSIKLSPTGSHYVFECHGPGIPRYELRLTEPPTLSQDVYSASPSAGQQGDILSNEQKNPIQSEQNGETAADNRAKSFLLKQRTSPTTFSTSTSTSTSSMVNTQNQNTKYTQQKQALGRQDNTLLWIIEDNRLLRDKINNVKAMPLTMRLKVPITNTNYSANVLMLLPPQLGYTTKYKGSSSSSSNQIHFAPSPTPFVGVGDSAYGDGPTSGAGQPQSQQQQQQQSSGRRLRLPRGLGPLVNGLPAAAAINNNHGGIQQQVHQHFTQETFAQFSSQLNAATGGQQYPMVVDVYGGPGSQKVDYRFAVNFGHYMASSRRTVYVMIDGRGSGYEGTKRLYELFHKFGTVEIQDQIDVATYLAKTYSFIDASKVAIWGWSYGGYAAAMALAKSNKFDYNNNNYFRQLQSASTPLNLDSCKDKENQQQQAACSAAISSKQASLSMQQPLFKQQVKSGIFECAVSVAPVTNWIYYDTAYTERYMSSPYLNEQFDANKSGDHFNNSMLDKQLASMDWLTRLSLYVNGPGGGSETGSSQVSRTLYSNLEAVTAAAAANEWFSLNKTLNIEDNPLKQHQQVAGNDDRGEQVINKTNKQLLRISEREHNRMLSVVRSLDLNQRFKTASLIDNIATIDKKKFLLIHGTADDNVHFQQSIMLMKQLISKNILFESRLYPDQDHSIGNKADKLHLGSTLSNFFAECFNMPY